MTWESRHCHRWGAGPFPYPRGCTIRSARCPADRVADQARGLRRLRSLAGRDRGLGAHSRARFCRMEVYHRGAGDEKEVRSRDTFTGSALPNGMVGASERRWRRAATRLGELRSIFLKASELRLRGASERLFAGAASGVCGRERALVRGCQRPAPARCRKSLRRASEWSGRGASEGAWVASGTRGARTTSGRGETRTQRITAPTKRPGEPGAIAGESSRESSSHRRAGIVMPTAILALVPLPHLTFVRHPEDAR